MKINKQFIFRNIADEYLLIPVGEAAISLKGLIALSESGALLFEKLNAGCSRQDLVEALVAEYDVSEAVAAEDAEAFLNQMRQLNMLTED